ncbi:MULTISPECIES: hypothetical protein [unclassified Paraburkholderia]|uniref:hypothetical protein n=1 Tax=unclassified Paraburkholderia TaxID=2615204 RepID=UPI002AB6AF92|nr:MULTISPECIES: hypothetical protein [unclassified Paraburkholderia]
MKRFTILLAVSSCISTYAYAEKIYDDYDAFYADQPGAIFKTPLKQDRRNVYSNFGENGIYAEIRATINGRPARIQVASGHISINKKTYRFAQAITFPNEHTGDIYPGTAEVFIAKGLDNRSPLLCLEGHGSGSGEANRRQQIFLLMNPFGHQPVFLHLPGLLSSCRAVLATHNGQVVFPQNSYVWNATQDARTGLQISYFAFERGRFAPTSKKINLRFVTPENPFTFYRQE